MYLEIPRPKKNREFQNEVTKKIDEYLLPKLKDFDGIKTYKHRTYILVDDIGIQDRKLAIRVPGLTIGIITYTGDYPDTMIIKSISINKYDKMMAMNYTEEIDSLDLSSYIGKPLILEEDYYGKDQ